MTKTMKASQAIATINASTWLERACAWENARSHWRMRDYDLGTNGAARFFVAQPWAEAIAARDERARELQSMYASQ